MTSAFTNELTMHKQGFLPRWDIIEQRLREEEINWTNNGRFEGG
jgi:hypothetical protein